MVLSSPNEAEESQIVGQDKRYKQNGKSFISWILLAINCPHESS